MSTVVDQLPSIRYNTVISPTKSLLKNTILNNEDDHYFDQLTDRSEPSSQLIYGNVRSNAPIVISFGHQQSPLRTKLVTYLVAHDIVLILFLIEEHLWQWLDSNPSCTVTSLVLQPTINSQEIIARSHSYISIRSILVRSTTAELITLRRYSRTYIKVDGIYNDDTRLLIKLVFDLVLVSEEIADQQIEDNDNELEAERNYDRALKLCALVKKVSSTHEA